MIERKEKRKREKGFFEKVKGYVFLVQPERKDADGICHYCCASVFYPDIFLVYQYGADCEKSCVGYAGIQPPADKEQPGCVDGFL